MKNMRKNKFLWIVLSFILLFAMAGAGWADNKDEPCTIMHPDHATLMEWITAYENAPEAYIDYSLSVPLKGSYSLLSHLNYVPSERNQGYCGNCWAWAGTGVMGIALDVDENVSDRLSVQYINSCENAVIGKTCCSGGWLSDVASFYSASGYQHAIPWSNTNAYWQDGDVSCDTACSSISTTPNYPIDSIAATTITTHSVGSATAIANIKNVLNQGKAVTFSFFLARGADWDNFRNFWWNQGENVTWNPDFSCGHTWEENKGGGHAVLCVGYNDDDPNNRYWIIVNSWGTAGGGRPNGIFHLDMDMDYDCTFQDGGSYWSFYWETLELTYGTIAQPDLVVTGILTDPAEPDPGETVNIHVTVKNQGTGNAGGFYLDWYANESAPPSPPPYGDQYEFITSLAPGASYTMDTTYTYNTTGIYHMYAYADTEKEVTESNEYNNVMGPVNIIVGPCECDINHDGRCDMQDWLLFGGDWGRTDCPIPLMAADSPHVADNSNPSGNPQDTPAASIDYVKLNVQSTGELDNPGDEMPLQVQDGTGIAGGDVGDAPVAAVQATPLWTRLENLSLADKQNALIKLELMSSNGSTSIQELGSVESLWNSGSFNEAVQDVKDLENSGVSLAAGITWKIPKQASGLGWYDPDLRVTMRDSVQETHLDFDAQTKHVFAVVKRSQVDSYLWTVNIAPDGQNWQETYVWYASSGIVVDLSATVVDDYLYVGYVYDDGTNAPSDARIRRFSVSTGGSDIVYGWKTVFDKGSAIKEIALCSNADDYDNRVYYFAILSNYNLAFFWANQDGSTWNEHDTGVEDALSGLDVTWNSNGSGGSDLYASYINFILLKSNENIGEGSSVTVWDTDFATDTERVIHSFSGAHWMTSISAYADTVLCAYEEPYTNGMGIRYNISYDGGSAWNAGYWAPDAGHNYYNPDLTARGGQGTAIVYDDEAGAFDPVWFRYRDHYSSGPWDAEVKQINTFDGATAYPNQIEWLPPLGSATYAYGASYISFDPDPGTAYFDRSDGNTCECDINHDGRCDMQDWLLFGADWGRTDCPVP